MRLSIRQLGSVLVLSSTLAFAVQAGTPGFQPNALPLDCGTTMVGGLVRSRTLAITNTGTATLNITSATISGSEFFFSPVSIPLPTTVPPGGTTQPFIILFNPAGAGARSGQMVVQDDAPGNPHTIGLVGFGVTVAPGDFAILAPNNIPITGSLPAGATFIFDLVATGGPNNITLTCSGAPKGSVCTVPPSVGLAAASVNGSDSTEPVRVSISTSAPIASLRGPRPGFRHPGFWWTATLAIGLALAAGRKRGVRMAVLTLCLCAMLAGIVTCGSGNGAGSAGTPPGAYTVILTATGNGGIVHTVPMTLAVRPAGTP